VGGEGGGGGAWVVLPQGGNVRLRLLVQLIDEQLEHLDRHGLLPEVHCVDDLRLQGPEVLTGHLQSLEGHLQPLAPLVPDLCDRGQVPDTTGAGAGGVGGKVREILVLPEEPVKVPQLPCPLLQSGHLLDCAEVGVKASERHLHGSDTVPTAPHGNRQRKQERYER